MIIRGGVNVFPETIEDIICQDKNIKQAVVLGKNNSFIYEKIVVWLVLWQEEETERLKKRLQKNVLRN